jgi:copper chaperone CopZ
MKKLLATLLALGLIASVALAGTSNINVSIKGMVCSSCAKKMETKFKAQDGVQNVSVDLKKGMVKVTMKDGKNLTDEQIKALVDDQDYSVAAIKRM